MKKILVSSFVAMALTVTSVASAGPILSGVVNGVLFCAADNQLAGVCAGGGTFIGDLDPTLGSLFLGNNTLGGVTVNASTHTQDIGTQNSLDSQSLQIINNTGGTVNAQVSVGGVGYTGPVTSIQSSGSGTFTNAIGSSINMNWYADMLNAQGGETFNDTPGVLLASFGTLAAVNPFSFSTPTFITPFVDPNLFSMTTNFSMSLVAGGQLNSRGQTMIATQSVPDGGLTMAMLGFSMVGLGFARRKFSI